MSTETQKSDSVKKMLQGGKEAREKKTKDKVDHEKAVKVEITDANQGKSDEEISKLIKTRLDDEKTDSDIASTRKKLDDLVIKRSKSKPKPSGKGKTKVGEFADLSTEEKSVIRTMRKLAKPDKDEAKPEDEKPEAKDEAKPEDEKPEGETTSPD